MSEMSEPNQIVDHDKKIYSRNQFMLRSAIVAIVNLVLVIVWLFTERNNSNFASHFSFASTVTSIILSVLAIFMSVTGEAKTQAIRDKIEKETDEIMFLTTELQKQMIDLKSNMQVVAADTTSIKNKLSSDPGNIELVNNSNTPLEDSFKSVENNSDEVK